MHIPTPRPAILVLVATMALFHSPAEAEIDSFSVQIFDVGSSPEGLAFDGTNIWVTDFFGNALIKVRASDGVILATYYIFEPIFVACDGASVWVTNELGKVTKFRGSDGTIEATITLGTSPLSGILFDGNSIWVAGWGVADYVYKLRVRDGKVLGSYSVGADPRQLAFDGANIWVTNSYGDTVSKLRASDGQLLFTVPAGDSPNGIVFDGHDIWVANSYPGGPNPAQTLTKLRLSDGAIIGSTKVGLNPQLLGFDGSHIWAGTYSPETALYQMRSRDGSRKRAFALGINPEGILFDGTSIWVAYYGSGTLCKITPAP